ncbi:MAG TPA: serine/threonine-protein kinase [Candidatus Limnocylindrales bacterium]|nr:serine/threonine-protein kinase [Candidatus Limnocylindrales bacterium]
MEVKAPGPGPGSEYSLGRYRLVERLGEGASSTVWRALDEQSGREVTLKLLHEHLAQDGAAITRLRREAEAAGSASHPGLVPLLAAHLDGPRQALAFEYVPGESLAARLAREGVLEPATACTILGQVAEALAHAHRHGLVHRDVKPSNVLLGADGRVRMLDFGVSGDVGRPTDEAGTAVGTPAYMAPEQLAGQPPHPASDVFAVGVVLYLTLSGRLPFPADDPHALARHQLRPPSAIAGAAAAASVPALVALSHDMAERPTMDALADWLRALADPERNPTTVPPGLCPARRRRA